MSMNYPSVGNVGSAQNTVPTDCCTPKAPDRAIPSLIADMASTIGLIERNIDQFSARIDPILLPRGMDEKPAPPRPTASTALGELLLQMRERLSKIAATVDDMEKRAQL